MILKIWGFMCSMKIGMFNAVFSAVFTYAMVTLLYVYKRFFAVNDGQILICGLILFFGMYIGLNTTQVEVKE